MNSYTDEPMASETDMDRVREIILGNDSSKQRFLKPEVDRLREMIFGEQIEEYERLFSDVKRDIERTQSDLRHIQNSISDFEKSQARQLEAIEREVSQLSAEVRRQTSQIQSHQAAYQQLLNQSHQKEVLMKKLQAQHEEQVLELTQQQKDLRSIKSTVEEYQDKNSRKLNGVNAEIRQVEDKLFTELRRFADRLNVQKPDRKTLATMFMEIATRLETGGTVTNLLEDLTGPTSK
jgi:chromosome segregation ATPase